MSDANRFGLGLHQLLAGLGVVMTISFVRPGLAEDELERVPVAAKPKLIPIAEPEQKIFHAPPLYRKTRLDFENSPLDEVLDALCKSVDLKLEFDEDRLMSAGYSKDTPITLKSERLFLQDALSQVLKPFDRLSFTVDGDKIFVSTRQRVQARANARRVAEKERIAEQSLQQKHAVIPLEVLAHMELKGEGKLHLPFNDSVNGTPVLEVLTDIAESAGLKLELDHPEIWAGGGNDELWSTPVRFMDIGERLHHLDVDLQTDSWVQRAKKRDDGTIRVKEALIGILEPLALSHRASNGVLSVSSYHKFETANEKIDEPLSRIKSKSDGLQTRIVTNWYHAVGNPIELTIEVKNFGQSSEQFDNQIASLDRWVEVIGPDAKAVPFRGKREEKVRTPVTVKQGETVVLFRTGDFNESFNLAQTGNYSIRFRAIPTEKGDDSQLWQLSDSYDKLFVIGDRKN